MINILFILLAAYVLWRTNLRTSIQTLVTSNTAMHLFLASSLSITLLAFLKAGTSLAMPLHFLGLTCITLILGQRLALLACFISALGLLFTQKLIFEQMGIFLIGSMMIPIIIFELFRVSVINKIKKSWQFILILASFGAVISFVVKTIINAFYYYFVADIPFSQIMDNYIYLSALFWIPEMMLNGTIIMTLIQHKPHWVASYATLQSNK